MTVLVQMRVKAPDVEQFKTAYADWEPRLADFGARSLGVYQAEGESGEVTLLEEWDSHDSMHEASEKYGDEFNAAAGTEGLDWETRIWHKL
jgi:quinol monooxygenase YgiN